MHTSPSSTTWKGLLTVALCGRCFSHIKPVVAVDLDGTLGDYHAHFLAFAGGYFSWPRFDWEFHGGAEGSFREYVMQTTGISERDWHNVKLAYRQGGMKRTMPMFIGAQAFCWAVRDAGAELWITTTRPYLSLDNIVPDTEEWLRRYDIAHDGLLFDDDKYRILAERVDPERVVAIFDDLPEYVAAANKVFPGRGWLVRGNWNRAVRQALICDLDSAVDIAINEVNHWKEAH